MTAYDIQVQNFIKRSYALLSPQNVKNMKPNIQIFSDEIEIANGLGKKLKSIIHSNNKKGRNTYILLSGGNTPKKIFQAIADQYSSKIDWSKTHFFWVDERCVPSDNP